MAVKLNDVANELALASLEDSEEKTPDWLVQDYIPRGQITSLAGDGGIGKSTVWAAIAAAVSSGNRTFLETYSPIGNTEPQKVVVFSSEDSVEYTLRRRLRKNGADLKNIFAIDVADERFQRVKFNNNFLCQLLSLYQPALCIFDPIQGFIPPDIHMGDRNAMRACLSPLIGYGERFGTAFLIVEHSNKQAGVWGRKRIADSADIWDISRSVLMVGETGESGGIRYISHEKSNYGITGDTVLFTIEDETILFKGYSKKKDRDFVMSADFNNRQAPAKEDAKEFILEFLQDGEKPVSELDTTAEAMSISRNSLKNAKSDLIREKKIKVRNTGSGVTGNKKFYASLL